MRARRWLLVAALLAAGSAQADDFRLVGGFGDVESRDGGEHCHGYSLGLWRHGDRLLGLFDVHEGLCGDPPCAAIGAARLDPATGELAFTAVVRDEPFAFDGRLSKAGVEGALNGKRVQLVPDTLGVYQDNPTDTSFAAWCGFWRTVGRCEGVAQLCGGAAVPAR
jgi:hypothetical protein